uniref:Ig-like domain-containing protein n=1 Tax=Cyprinus carpio TaxID=7962 RepID=A0A8C2CZI9_CYPCA
MELNQLPLVLLLISNIHSGHTEDFPKPTVTVEPQSSVFTGDSVTLRCELDQTGVSWEFLWIKDSKTELTEAASKTIDSVKVSDGGEYKCRARREGHYTNYSEPVTVTIYERPKAKVTIKPDQHVLRGETVTLRCDTYSEGVPGWQYSWYKEERGGSRRSQNSDAVTLTVSELRAVLSVSPQKWLTEGDPVTLICEVNSSSTDWTLTWYTVTISSDYSIHHYKLLSDSRNYTVSSAALNHTGVYVCRAERIKPAYYTTISDTQPLWVTGCSPPVSLVINPSRTQHFTSVSLSLSCEDQSNSGKWRVRRYTESWGLQDCSSSVWVSQSGSTCTISSTITSDTGVYWCQSESGEKYHPVNITVHFFVILESPVHPVTEGDSLTLRCLYKHSTTQNLRANFYLLSQSHKRVSTPANTQREESHPRAGSQSQVRVNQTVSWFISSHVLVQIWCLIKCLCVSSSVSHSGSQISVLHTLSSVLAVCPYLLVTVVLIFKCCRMRGVTPDSR